MYTVGYSMYYGYSLLCRSYPLLFTSLVAHLLQIAFLVAVEEPHIERTYVRRRSCWRCRVLPSRARVDKRVACRCCAGTARKGRWTRRSTRSCTIHDTDSSRARRYARTIVLA